MAATAKTYGLAFEEVLYNLSYTNLLLYNAVLPSYRPKDKDGKQRHDVIKADDPRNRARVKQFLSQIE